MKRVARRVHLIQLKCARTGTINLNRFRLAVRAMQPQINDLDTMTRPIGAGPRARAIFLAKPNVDRRGRMRQNA
jgi:hypothetical protein